MNKSILALLYQHLWTHQGGNLSPLIKGDEEVFEKN